MLPTVCILLLTYNRLEYAKTTLRSTLRNMTYHGNLVAHIADDGSPEGYIDELLDITREVGIRTTFSNSGRNSYGGNYNLATQSVHQICEACLVLEDDWELVKPLDLDCFAEGLEWYGCIRMGYLGYTQQLKGTFEYHANKHWIKLDADSPEPHVFAGHPRLETVEWERNVGPWPEGLEPGMTEFAVAHIPAARENVAWPMDLIFPAGSLFHHIGAERSY